MKLQGYALVTMNVYWFGLAFMWNALHPIVLPALLLDLVPDVLKNTYLGAMTFVGLLSAIAIQPLAGALSDRTPTRWGRRRSWMVSGTLASMLILGLMVWAHRLWELMIAYLILQVVSNMAHGPAQGLIPDLVPAEHRGLAAGIKNLFDMGGLIVTSLVAGQVMQNGNPRLAFAIIGAVLLTATAVTVTTTREPVPDRAFVAKDRWAGLLRPGLSRHPTYAKLLVGRFLILLGVYVVQSFSQYYIRDWIGVPNAAAVTGNLMAAIGVTLMLLVSPAGWLSDRVGRWPLNVGAGGLAALGIVLLVPARSVLAVYAFGAIIGMATGTFLSVNWALATDLIPPNEGGKYLGLSNLATAGAGATSRLAGPLIDGLNAAWRGSFVGYPVTFALAALATFGGALLLARLWQRQRHLDPLPEVQNQGAL